MKRLFLAMVLAAMAMATALGQDHNHDQTHKGGNAGMGFDQDKTAHHFLPTGTGGIIQVAANSGTDTVSVAEIRKHLQHIRHAFESGDFNIPAFVHDQTPPGVPTMTRLKDQLHYEYQEMDNGGRVVIRTQNAEARSALYEFLKFQIREHRTGDPLEVK
jgi:opacity protein-like surface antigen